MDATLQLRRQREDARLLERPRPGRQNLGERRAQSLVISLAIYHLKPKPGKYLRGSITVPLTSYLTGLYLSVLQIKTKIVSCHTADSKQVKQEVDGTMILPPLVFIA
jgi:hypothetical protein